MLKGLLLLVIVSVFFFMYDQESRSLEMDSGGVGPILIVFCFICALLFCIYYKQKISKLMIFFLLFYIYVDIVNMLTTNAAIHVRLYYIAYYTLPVLMMIICYSYTRVCGLNTKLLNFIFLLFFIIVFQYLRIRYETGSNNFLFTGTNRLYVVNYPLLFLPLLLSHPNTKYRIGSMFLMVAIVFVSGKRSALIALPLALFIFIFDTYFTKNRNKLRSVVILSLFFIALFYFSYWMDDLGGGLILERLRNITYDGGSDRDLVWIETLRLIVNQSPTQTIFGSGINGVERNSFYGLSAHNDFLEIRYDYGIVGTILFLIPVIVLFYKSFKYMQKKNKYSAQLLCFLSLFISLSMVSHVVYYYLMVVCALSIGMLLGAAENDEFHFQKDDHSRALIKLQKYKFGF